MPDDDGHNVIASVWVPTLEEREQIANGMNVRLLVWGTTIQPFAMDITDEKLGRRRNGELHQGPQEGSGG
jgi:hypothetical protein